MSEYSLPFVLTVESAGLYSTMSTLHDTKDYRLRPTVSRLRDSFESSEIHTVYWIPAQKNVSDALTKRNIVIYKLLNDI